MVLIINADDFGWNTNCTQAIYECLVRGWISCTTLMVNMASSREAVELARKKDLLDRIGLHLNIYGGMPLTKEIQSCRDFCNESGEFRKSNGTGILETWRPLDAASRSALALEVKTQFARYVEMGLPVRHFDSHHHSHMVMRVLPIVADIARDFGFITARRGINVQKRKNPISDAYYAFQDFCQCRILDTRHLKHTRYMCNFNNFKENIDRFSDNATVELMVHPCYSKDGVLDDTGELSDSGLYPMAEIADFVNKHRDKLTIASFADFAKQE